MLASEDQRIREKGVRIVKKFRDKPARKPRKIVLQGIRQREVSILQWDATTWDDIIDWDKISVYEPNILEKLTMEQLSAAIESPLELPKFPLHSQSVERSVKLVTEASTQVSICTS